MTVTVADIMSTDIKTLRSSATIDSARDTLSRAGTSGMAVLDDKSLPVGVITIAELAEWEDRKLSTDDDSNYPIFYRVQDDRFVPDEATRHNEGTVSEAMQPFVLSIPATATLRQATARMLGEGVCRLLVLSEGRLVGVVSALDLLAGYGQKHTDRDDLDTDRDA